MILLRYSIAKMLTQNEEYKSNIPNQTTRAGFLSVRCLGTALDIAFYIIYKIV